MIILPKNIVSNFIKRHNLDGKANLIFLGFCFILTCIDIKFIWFFILACVGIYFSRDLLNSFAREVVDNSTGLAITTEKAHAHIGYQDILQIEYTYSFSFSKNVVKLIITPHATLGDTVRFISWADTYSLTKSDETYA